MTEKSNNKIIKTNPIQKSSSFEAKQNAIGFFSLLLKIAKRNPELWKQIYNDEKEYKNNNDINQRQ
jgi:hypothetical protein